jgi:hypothetical protein
MDLGPIRGRNETGEDSLNDPCDLEPALEINNQITPPVSPTGIELGNNGQVPKAGDDSGGDPTPNTVVRINNTPPHPTHQGLIPRSLAQVKHHGLSFATTPPHQQKKPRPLQLPRPLHPTTHQERPP